uniref:putative ubiquitin-like protein FUBI-like protein ENSP00000310146 n=1 Tax=Odobenus rosmarus divergens TaxID=9708 RepID=UPI00063C1FE9|nr:PREDICTED: putative ubiquitin-like protein FUBI-like protein ENSP00000310146 [Odobenus rosmarus divergens]
MIQLFLNSILKVAAAWTQFNHVDVQLFVRAQERHTLEMTGQETVAQMKVHVASLEGNTPEDQIDLLPGLSLEAEVTLGQCGVEALTTLEVASPILGGKVHSSLARAGKVRGQTPKVAKQEKSASCTDKEADAVQSGHLVNVVPTFGKMKGPNANS